MKKKAVIIVILAVVVALIIGTLARPVDMGALDGYVSPFYATPLSLLPPVIAIVLALITKEVYSSLFVGIVAGALLYSNFNVELGLNTMLFNEEGGMIFKLADSWNVGILVFLVLLGILVALMNKAGGSAAFGRWAVKHIKTRVGAQLATIVLGILIFVDDYFNCLTVGSVMRPVTDTHKVSRSKLSYLIDATAAPVCIIAPISSWAAAVTSSVPDDAGINGFVTFLRTIPYNFYALLTILMMVVLVVRRIDYGPMRKHELNAIAGDLFTTGQEKFTDDDAVNQNGRVADLIIPVLVLIAACIMGMVYTGGFFSGEGFVTAFANADASVGLVIGGIIAVIFAFFYYLLRGVLTFKEFTACIPEGFKAMLAPILILTLAWTLSGMTGLLGAKYFVANLVAGSAAAVQILLPAIIFLVALGLAFATGTSWGTFGILIPIVLGVFPEGEMMVISIAACLAGAVCGDHCSPISDTTIMASAGGQCNHINHVSTQLPYALTCAAVCFVAYIFAGLTKNPAVSLVIGAALMIVVLLVIEKKTGREKVA
ncbi:MAG: Na+/H+ antiporter NhaC family protein [Lachnospiraceae bacterium]|nr:Na+/H+ antiporter NhaC family protein [Lachnospiraceae bacterium]MBR2738018.1 Na+/H+ antiporter NhaC family protein [Lachnospiraceae bacterium]